MPDLTLYYKPTCPFCRKVLNFMKEQGETVPLKDINKSVEFRQELIEAGGKAQVPCLLINDQALYESDDIIVWLKNHRVA